MNEKAFYGQVLWYSSIMGGAAGITMLPAITPAADHAGDTAVAQAALVVAAGVAGSMMLTYPRGFMALGAGVVYFLGFVLAQLRVLLRMRVPREILPWFVMVVAAHATMESAFSIVRRRLLAHRCIHATAPSRQQLQPLVFRHFKKGLAAGMARRRRAWLPNAEASALLLAAAAVPIALTLLHPISALWGLCLLVLSATKYGAQLHRLVYFWGSRPLRHSAAVTVTAAPDTVLQERGA